MTSSFLVHNTLSAALQLKAFHRQYTLSLFFSLLFYPVHILLSAALCHTVYNVGYFLSVISIPQNVYFPLIIYVSLSLWVHGKLSLSLSVCEHLSVRHSSQSNAVLTALNNVVNILFPKRKYFKQCVIHCLPSTLSLLLSVCWQVYVYLWLSLSLSVSISLTHSLQSSRSVRCVTSHSNNTVLLQFPNLITQLFERIWDNNSDALFLYHLWKLRECTSLSLSVSVCHFKSLCLFLAAWMFCQMHYIMQ